MKPFITGRRQRRSAGAGERREEKLRVERNPNKARHPLPDRSSPSPALLTRMWHLRGWCLVIAGLINIPRYASWRWTPCQCRPPPFFFSPSAVFVHEVLLLSLSVTGSVFPHALRSLLCDDAHGLCQCRLKCSTVVSLFATARGVRRQ